MEHRRLPAIWCRYGEDFRRRLVRSALSFLDSIVVQLEADWLADKIFDLDARRFDFAALETWMDGEMEVGATREIVRAVIPIRRNEGEQSSWSCLAKAIR